MIGFSSVFVVCLSVEQKPERNIIKREKVYNVRSNRINGLQQEQFQDVPYQVRANHKNCNSFSTRNNTISFGTKKKLQFVTHPDIR